ncbi:hypothetical protein BFS30_17890 [Pedobacter steynii]|uniref:Uncharacterized protein n=1 Tax=Pedobacter steynii TaxID=430522 RepID=A0A1D7QJM5_9SPHI|nr:hypothetical protein BFS30_17890 [Pedobacter steynii]
MNNQKDTKRKQGVVPESELQGSDADRAYNEQGEFPKLDKDISGSNANGGKESGEDEAEDKNLSTQQGS